MKLMDDALFELWRDGKTTREDVLSRAHSVDELAKRIVTTEQDTASDSAVMESSS